MMVLHLNPTSLSLLVRVLHAFSSYALGSNTELVSERLSDTPVTIWRAPQAAGVRLSEAQSRQWCRGRPRQSPNKHAPRPAQYLPLSNKRHTFIQKRSHCLRSCGSFSTQPSHRKDDILWCWMGRCVLE
ncbi:hypothetical protein BC826DRAFT_167170 [Russula brevipes]|nr:hypothetical protein BC826DRAFT_167170 [Russula brevipes]